LSWEDAPKTVGYLVIAIGLDERSLLLAEMCPMIRYNADLRRGHHAPH
jgi:hypothetical protein